MVNSCSCTGKKS